VEQEQEEKEEQEAPTHMATRNSFSGRWVTMTASFIKLHAVGEELQFGVKASFKVRPGSNLPILWPRCDISGTSPVFFLCYIFLFWPRGF